MKKILLLLVGLLFLSGCGKPKVPSEEILNRLDSYVEETGGIYESVDGTLISLYPHHEWESYINDYDTVKTFADASDIPVYVAFPPRKMDAMTSCLPEDFPTEHTEYLYSMAEYILSDSKAVYIDLYSLLKGNTDAYLKTDHHWSNSGVYLAYEKIVEAMGVESVPQENFNISVLLENYQGSDHTKKKDSQKTDVMTGAVPEGEFMTELVRFPYDSNENNISFEGFYDYSQLDTGEKYGVFLGGNEPYIRITKVGEKNRDRLLLVRDSFASALAPYLAEHFDLVLIDPRFYPESVSKAVQRENAFAVLVLENMGSVTESEIKFKW